MSNRAVNISFLVFVSLFAISGTFIVHTFDYYLGTHRGPVTDYYNDRSLLKD